MFLFPTFGGYCQKLSEDYDIYCFREFSPVLGVKIKRGRVGISVNFQIDLCSATLMEALVETISMMWLNTGLS